jgi:hypothetical protein
MFCLLPPLASLHATKTCTSQLNVKVTITTSRMVVQQQNVKQTELSCFVLLCHVLVILRQAMLCSVMLCRAVLRSA